MLGRERLALGERERIGRAYRVLDLAAIQLHGGKLVDTPRRPARLAMARRAPQEEPPQVGPARGVQRVVLEREVDARLKGLVKRLHAIGGQEHDAGVVLEHTQKDCAQ